jgi:large subunit ribosomal protein L23
MRKDAYSIIKRPIVTEKSMAASALNKYVFEVAKDSNKIEIGKAVEEIFKVKVDKVNTLTVKGKTKRMGRNPSGKTPDWKKAVVTLQAGHRIELFEGM